MAYIIGLVSPEEKAELERRGWEIETPPTEFETDPYTDNLNHKMIMVWVDSNLFDIMDGPDWEKGK